MGDIAQRGNRLTKGVKDLVTAPYKGAKKVVQGAKDLITAPSKRIKKFGGGRTNLLEQLGRVEAEPSNPNRRAEISRVHGELNRGYAKGGRVGLKHGGKPWGAGPKPGTHEFLEHHLHKPRKKKVIGGLVKNIPKLLKKLGKEVKAQPLPPQLQKTLDEVKKLQELQKPRVKKAAGGRAGYAIGSAVKIGKTVKKYAKEYHKKKKLAEDTKKGKFPETESLTHQVGPYVGDVGSERPGIKRREWGKRPGGKSKPDRKLQPYSPGRPPPGTPAPKWKRPIDKFPPPKRKSIPPIGKFPPEKGKWQKAAEGGRIGLKKGGSDKKWIQKAVDPKHKGYCTPMTKKTCTPARKALARTFKKKAKTGWG